MADTGSATAGPTDKPGRVAGRVENSRAFSALITVGLVAYGVVHLLVAWIAGQIAWTGTSDQASQKGAFQQMASTSFGDVLLWITAIGLFTLALWQAIEAGWGHRDREAGRKRLIKRLGSAGKAALYLTLAISALGTVTGSSSSGDATEKSFTSSLMSSGFGRVVVIAVGLAVVFAGGRLVYRGVTRKFTRDLAGGVGRGVITLGQIGFAAKGVALAIIGILFVLAAVTYDPNKAGGMDSALRTLGAQPFGAVLLTVVALGIGCFGLYCFAWSRHVKKT